jgi:hypothetical protein
MARPLAVVLSIPSDAPTPTLIEPCGEYESEPAPLPTENDGL